METITTDFVTAAYIATFAPVMFGAAVLFIGYITIQGLKVIGRMFV